MGILIGFELVGIGIGSEVSTKLSWGLKIIDSLYLIIILSHIFNWSFGINIFFHFSFRFFPYNFQTIKYFIEYLKVSMKLSWGLLKIDSLYLIFILSYIFNWTFDIIKKRKYSGDHLYISSETCEVNFLKTNKNYDIYSWHWLLFGLIYLNISSFISNVLFSLRKQKNFPIFEWK